MNADFKIKKYLTGDHLSPGIQGFRYLLRPEERQRFQQGSGPHIFGEAGGGSRYLYPQSFQGGTGGDQPEPDR